MSRDNVVCSSSSSSSFDKISTVQVHSASGTRYKDKLRRVWSVSESSLAEIEFTSSARHRTMRPR